ncbi:MAG: hypothetical protein HY231_19390 [Acidobacteria bacterium]|nr:hypothetical protein [Acidobacteriota bacterium]
MSEIAAAMPSISIDIEKERTKPRLVALLFCEYGSVSKDGKPSIAGVFDRVHIKPNSKYQFFMFVRIAEALGALEIQMFNPDGKINSGAHLEPLKDIERSPENISYL